MVLFSTVISSEGCVQVMVWRPIIIMNLMIHDYDASLTIDTIHLMPAGLMVCQVGIYLSYKSSKEQVRQERTCPSQVDVYSRNKSSNGARSTRATRPIK